MESLMTDRLKLMWEQQREFIILLQKTRGFPEFPVDLTSKKGQQFLKEISHECSDELHEARQELKNSKKHQKTDINEINRNAYVEELSDVLHYFFEICIMSGISIDELYDSYMKKGLKNHSKIMSGF